MSDADRLYGRKTRKNYSSPLMSGFGASLLLLAAYVLGYALMFSFGGGAVQETGGFFSVWGPPLAVGVIVSALACIPLRFMKKSAAIPLGMAFLALYYAALAVALLTAKGTSDSGVALHVLNLFCLPCIIPGNLFAWIAWRHFRNRAEEDKR